MGTVLVKNNTNAPINVRITAANGDTGTEYFSTIVPRETSPWERKYWQFAIIFREDNSQTETFVVKPNEAYTVG